MKCTRLRSVSTYFTLTLGLFGLLTYPARAADTAVEDPGSEGDGEYQVGPDYKIDPDLTDRGNPKGKCFEFSMPLAESKIFRGEDATLQPDKKPVRKERMI